ncbi:MAG TPA: choice-of-anchor L domain-containing protein, partial [Flavobacteriales bacterium]|nr:choice-of-anchor L domain-containing protein [Flavobacteriales bacterium]
MRTFLRTIALSFGGVLGSSLPAQLLVDGTLTPEQLVQNVLLGGGVTVSNITFNGVAMAPVSEQAGSFIAPAGSNLGLEAGLILSSGLVVSDPDNFDYGANGDVDDFASNQMGGGSDADLELLSGQAINDAAILEFDFVPTGDSLQFRYVFGSEEYPSFTCSNYNDAFGFFLSGPG